MHTLTPISDPISPASLLPLSPSAANAWRHGMYARKVLVSAEDLPEFEALRDALVAEWRPKNVTAWMLVDHLAKLQWRLMRAGEAEVEKLAKLQTSPRFAALPGRAPVTPQVALADDAGRQDSTLHRIQVFQMRLERSMHRVIGQLITLKKLRGKGGGLGRGRARKISAETPAGPSIVGQTQNENGRNENGTPNAVSDRESKSC